MWIGESTHWLFRSPDGRARWWPRRGGRDTLTRRRALCDPPPVERAAMIDLHVHAAPCLLPRKGSDLEIARRFAAAGFAGFALKAHYESSVGRAAAVAEATGIEVWGGVVLNRTAGGINPEAV